MAHDARLEIAYADRRDDRMIIIGAAAWETMEEQERRFDELPAVEDSDFVVDFYDDEGLITKDKFVSRETVETVMGQPLTELIEEGRRREDELGAQLRASLSNPKEPQP